MVFPRINYSHYGCNEQNINTFLHELSLSLPSNSSERFIPAPFINLAKQLSPNNFVKIASRIIALPILEPFFHALCVFNASLSSYPLEYPQMHEPPSLRTQREECFSRYSLKLWEKESELPRFKLGSLSPPITNTVGFYLRAIRDMTDEETEVDIKFVEALIFDNIPFYSKIEEPVVQLLKARKKLMESRSIKTNLLSTKMKIALLNLITRTPENDYYFLVEKLPNSSTKNSMILSHVETLLGSRFTRPDPDKYIHNLNVLSEYENLSSLSFEENMALFDILTQNPTLFDAKLFEKAYGALVSNEKSHKISLLDFLTKAYKKNNWEAFDLLLNWIGIVDGIENLYTFHACLSSKNISPELAHKLQTKLASKSMRRIEPSGWHEYATSWLPNFIKC